MSKKVKPSVPAPASEPVKQPTPEPTPAVVAPPPPNDAPSEAQNEVFKRLFKYIALVALVIMSAMSFSYGISGDEQDMAEYGQKALKFYTSFGKDTSCFKTDLDKDGVLKYYGVWFDATAAAVGKVSPLWEYDTRHLLNSWVGWAAMLFAGLVVQLVAGWRAAIIAFVLLFISPSFFGHSMNNPKDIPFAFAAIFSLYWFMRVLQEMPKPSRKVLWWAMVGIGLAIGTRSIGGLILVGYLGLMFLLDLWRKHGIMSLFSGAMLPYFTRGLMIVAGGIGLGLLLWPYALIAPSKHIPIAFAKLNHFPLSLRELFEGAHTLSAQLPSYYLPKFILITNPLLVLAAAAATILLIVPILRRYDKVLIFMLFFAFAFPLSYIVYQKSNVYGGWRHVLFVYPPLVGLAAVSLETLLRLCKGQRVAKIAIWTLVGLSMANSTYWYVRSHPHQYIYYNELVGGVDGAYGNYELDYYFNSMRRTSDWFRSEVLDKLPQGDSVILVSNATKQLNFYFKDDKRVKVVYANYYNRNGVDWDYGMFCSKGVQSIQLLKGYYPPAGTIYTDGVGKAILGIVIKRPSKNDLAAFRSNQSGDFMKTIELATNYLQNVDSTDVSVRSYLANAYFQIGQLDKAMELSTYNQKFYPDHAGTLGVIGQVYMRQGKFQESIQTFRTLLDDNKDIFWAHYFQAINYANINNCDRAIAHIDTCVTINRTFRDAYTQGEAIATRCGYKAKAQQYHNVLLQLK